jgi:hypothetical protein
MSELPIACTLTPHDMAGRAEWLRRLGARSLIAGARAGGGLRLRFEAAADAEVGRWIDAERECCAFLTFAVERNGDELWLQVGGPPGSEPVLDGLLAALRGP